VLDTIKRPIVGMPPKSFGDSDELFKGAKVLVSVERTYVREGYSGKAVPVLCVEGRMSDPAMLIDASGQARLVRDRKTSSWSGTGECVYFNKKKYFLSDKPFEEPISKVLALYEQAIAELTPAQKASVKNN
jgi:hypothetical protein